jgi:hypothetical protein
MVRSSESPPATTLAPDKEESCSASESFKADHLSVSLQADWKNSSIFWVMEPFCENKLEIRLGPLNPESIPEKKQLS